MNAEKKRQFEEYAKNGTEFFYMPSKRRPNSFLILGSLAVLLVILVTQTPGGVKDHPWLFLGLFILATVLLIKAVAASLKMAKGYRFTKDAVWIVSKNGETELPFKRLASILLPGRFVRAATGNLISHLKIWTREGSGYRAHLLNDLPDYRIVSRLILDKAAAIQGVPWTTLVGNPYYLEYVNKKKLK